MMTVDTSDVVEGLEAEIGVVDRWVASAIEDLEGVRDYSQYDRWEGERKRTETAILELLDTVRELREQRVELVEALEACRASGDLEMLGSRLRRLLRIDAPVPLDLLDRCELADSGEAGAFLWLDR